MSGSPWIDTLIASLVIGVPVVLVLWYLRRPYDQGSVPRDALASRGKAKAVAPGMFIWPTRAFRESLINTADDASHDGVDCRGDEAAGLDANDFTDTEERRAQIVEDLKRRT